MYWYTLEGSTSPEFENFHECFEHAKETVRSYGDADDAGMYEPAYEDEENATLFYRIFDETVEIMFYHREDQVFCPGVQCVVTTPYFGKRSTKYITANA